jgi:hypothetical protein
MLAPLNRVLHCKSIAVSAERLERFFGSLMILRGRRLHRGTKPLHRSCLEVLAC